MTFTFQSIQFMQTFDALQTLLWIVLTETWKLFWETWKSSENHCNILLNKNKVEPEEEDVTDNFVKSLNNNDLKIKIKLPKVKKEKSSKRLTENKKHCKLCKYVMHLSLYISYLFFKIIWILEKSLSSYLKTNVL